MDFPERSHHCGELRAEHIGRRVSLRGWVDRRRDHGGVIFLDMRDAAGVAQAVFDPAAAESFALADQVRGEFVLAIEGPVRERSADTVNERMPTGAVEVVGERLSILSRAETPPFQLDGHIEVGEEARLRHRYVDLRRPEMLANLRRRATLARLIRAALEDEGFLEVETPMLTRATPEGARDYLVPSRVHAGHVYALPQSPQLFKQLLMIGGVDRYYQIARCFRDEDLRADRQPEFTQVDIEASFVDEATMMRLIGELLRGLFKECLQVDLGDIPTLSHAEAMRRYGEDRPDLRNPLELVEIADLMRDVEFKVFREPARADGSRVAALRVPGGAALSRGEIDALTEFAVEHGAGGLAWIKINERAAGRDGLQSPILKFIPEQVTERMFDRLEAADGDIVFFGADAAAAVNASLSAVRRRLGEQLNLLAEGWAPLWVVDFPMFARDDDGRLQAMHHPFTAPDCSVEQLRADPEAAGSRAYDIVLNGFEIGGGSMRIHDLEMQMATLELLGFDAEEAERRFGFLLEALRYGAPPHGGIALGLDRLAMLIAGCDSIREVIAFPKTQSAVCPMTKAPGAAEAGQLRELHLRKIGK